MGLLQTVIPNCPRWLQPSGIPKADLCSGLEELARAAGEEDDGDGAWQLGPAERPRAGVIYLHLEKLFLDAVSSLSWDFLDAMKHTMSSTSSQWQTAIKKMFDFLYIHSISDDSILALLTSARHRLPEVVEICIANSIETTPGTSFHSFLQTMY